MKKVLFVLGLALCSTFAMAQTNNAGSKLCASTTPRVAEKLVFSESNAPVDYKASIFTKDGDTELAHVTFANTNQFSIGVIGATDVIDDTVVGSVNCHNRAEVCFRWARIADTASIVGGDSTFNEDYNGLISYIGRANLLAGMGANNELTDNNGFMLISLTEQDEDNNAINTYFQLSQPIALQGAQVVDVTWRQLYRKYYDKCYLDYQLNGSWKSFEVNVTGVDCDVTGYATLYYVATMPTAAVNQSTLTLRFRITADGTLPYGYGWAIDDVKVISPANSTRWSFNSPGTINGFYGTLPHNMTVPMSYAVFARNIGAETLSGINLGIQHRYGDDSWSDWTTAFTVPQTGLAIPAGNPLADSVLEINESGFMMSGYGCGDYIGYHSFPEYYDQYRNTDAELAQLGYTRRGLPTQNVGRNQFLITADNAQGLADTLAAYTYTVSEELDTNSAFGRTIAGYRWGNDNGIVPGGSEFAYGFTGGLRPGYVTSDCGGHQYVQDYEVMTRYNTPSAIPTDGNGDPWVIRGIEFVTSTKVTAAQAAGARFAVAMYRYEMRPDASTPDTGWYGWMGYTGLTGSESYLVGNNNVAPTREDLIGYATAENGNYYAVNVLFPEQPALEPNTSFLLGYVLEGGGDWAVARQTSRYYSSEGSFDSASSYTYYRNDQNLAPYVNQFYPSSKPYDAYCYDPVQGSRGNGSHTVSGWNIDYYPMIRLIVGPKATLDTNYIFADCGDDPDNYWIYSYSRRAMACGMTDTALAGAVYSYLIFPGNPGEEASTEGEGDNEYYVADNNSDYAFNRVIDNIYLNGVAINLNDENMVTKYDYTFYWAGHTPGTPDQEWEPAIERSYYKVDIRDVTEDITITASTHAAQLNINNVEDNVTLGLAPNPATSQVRLNVGGFTGKANCSIIDMSGRVVYNADINAGETIINLNGVPAGAYFVRVTNNAFSKVEKLIVR